MKLNVEMEKPENDNIETEKNGTQPMDMVVMYSQSATINGVSKVAAPQIYRFRRSTWVVLLVAMSIGLGVLVYMQFVRYNEYPSVTIVKAEFHNELKFPAVTICNTNQYHRDRLPHNLPLLQLLYNLSEFSSIEKYLHQIREETGPGITGADQDSGDYLHSFAMAAAHTLDEMFLYCTWQGLEVNCSEIFEKVVTDLGICYQFNGLNSNTFTATGTGPATGLRLLLDIQQNFSFFSSTTHSGIKVLLNEANESPSMLKNGVYVRPGTSTSIGIEKEETIALESPYKAFGTSYCYNTEADGFKTPLKRFANFTYTRDTCLRSCMLTYMKDRCQCKHFFSSGEEDYCSIEQFEKCYLPTSKDTDTAKVRDLCMSCPSQCHEVRYATVISSADFASVFITDYMVAMGMMKDGDYVRNNMIDLRIYYDTLVVTKTEQKPELTVEGIIADLGGNMGLFLGASLLSLTELIEFLALFVIEFINKRRLKKAKKNASCCEEQIASDGLAMT